MDFADVADAELVRRCRQGDAAAWSVLVRRYQRLVYTIPRRARLPEPAAADVFQTTYARLFEHIDRLDDPSRVRAWLVTTARRETLRELRRAGREIAVAWPDDDEDGAAAPAWSSAAGGGTALAPEPAAAEAASGDDELAWHALRDAVDRLAPRCRQLIELLFLTEPEPSYADIGARLAMPIGSIGPTRSRCLAHLRRLLADR